MARRFTSEELTAMKKMAADPETSSRTIAARFGGTLSHIGSLRSRWRLLPTPYEPDVLGGMTEDEFSQHIARETQRIREEGIVINGSYRLAKRLRGGTCDEGRTGCVTATNVKQVMRDMNR